MIDVSNYDHVLSKDVSEYQKILLIRKLLISSPVIRHELVKRGQRTSSDSPSSPITASQKK